MNLLQIYTVSNSPYYVRIIAGKSRLQHVIKQQRHFSCV